MCSLATLTTRSLAQDAGAPPVRDASIDAAPDLRAPILLAASEAEYPVGETGEAHVTLELTIDEAGAVADSRVLDAPTAAFAAAAQSAASTLRFDPALRRGVPIAALIPFQFDFFPPPPPPPPSAAAPPPAAPSLAAPHPDSVSTSLELEVRGAPPLREPTRHSLDTAQVRTIPGTNGDVLRSVETMPGVARPAFGQGLLVVRGSAPADSQVFVDSTPIPYAYHLGDATSVIPGDMLERLDFYPGNFGPEFGRGMGGVIDVGLRSPRRDRLGGLVQIDAIDARAMLEAPLGEHTGLMLGVRRSWLDAWIGSLLENFDTSLRAAPVYWDGQAILEHDLTRRHRLRLSLFGADDRFSVLIKSPDPMDPALSGTLGGYSRFLRTQLRVTSELTRTTHLHNTVSWGLTDYDQTFGGNGFASTVHEVSLRSGLRAELAPWLTLHGGIDALWSRNDVRAQFRPYPGTNAIEGPGFARPARRVETVATLLRPALYAGLSLRPVPSLELMPSVRADYAADTEQLTLDPRVGARWDVAVSPQRTTLKGGLGLYRQPPQVEQSNDVVGTPGVESARAVHASVGVEQELAAGFELSLEGFYKRLSNLVIAEGDESRVIGARFDNSGVGRVVGAEALLRYAPPGGSFTGWVAYTLSRSERRDRPGERYEIFEWDQTHILSAVANLELGRGWSTGGRFRYVTGRPFTPYLGGVVDLDAGAYSPLLEGRLYSARLEPFHQLDLRVEKRWELEPGSLAVYLEVRNVYNHGNAEDVGYSYDYAERAAESGLPILPVLGLRGEL